MAGKRFDSSAENAICLEKARGRGPIALAMERGCQLASSDNCFPWQDPVGREEEERGVGSRRGNPFSPQPGHNCSASARILVANLREGQALIDTH